MAEVVHLQPVVTDAFVEQSGVLFRREGRARVRPYAAFGIMAFGKVLSGLFARVVTCGPERRLLDFSGREIVAFEILLDAEFRDQDPQVALGEVLEHVFTGIAREAPWRTELRSWEMADEEREPSLLLADYIAGLAGATRRGRGTECVPAETCRGLVERAIAAGALVETEETVRLEFSE